MISQGTVPELSLQRALSALGLEFEAHVRDLPGTPDIVFSADEIAVFVHGCYWHRHENCSNRRTSGTDTLKWMQRHRATVARDQRVTAELVRRDWWVMVAWECEIREDVSAVALRSKSFIEIRRRQAPSMTSLSPSRTSA